MDHNLHSRNHFKNVRRGPAALGAADICPLHTNIFRSSYSFSLLCNVHNCLQKNPNQGHRGNKFFLLTKTKTKDLECASTDPRSVRAQRKDWCYLGFRATSLHFTVSDHRKSVQLNVGVLWREKCLHDLHLLVLLPVADRLRQYLVRFSTDQSHWLQVVVERVFIRSQLVRLYHDLYAQILLGVLQVLRHGRGNFFGSFKIVYRVSWV